MRVAKFVSITAFITCFCLLYVYQQTEIFRLAYVGQRKLAYVYNLLEKNSILRYNIRSNTSLACIGDRLSKSSDFQMPDSYRLVRLAPSQGRLMANQNMPRKEALLTRLFGIKRQAEAKTISP